MLERMFYDERWLPRRGCRRLHPLLPLRRASSCRRRMDRRRRCPDRVRHQRRAALPESGGLPGQVSGPQRQTRLRDLTLLFLREHWVCLTEAAGGRFTHLAVVPSTSGRPGPHPLTGLVAAHVPLPAPGSRSISPTPRPSAPSIPAVSRFGSRRAPNRSGYWSGTTPGPPVAESSRCPVPSRPRGRGRSWRWSSAGCSGPTTNPAGRC